MRELRVRAAKACTSGSAAAGPRARLMATARLSSTTGEGCTASSAS
jgi:hypothetical protein